MGKLKASFFHLPVARDTAPGQFVLLHNLIGLENQRSLCPDADS
jgi:hypothetical protein